jgi:hypothetical protein
MVIILDTVSLVTRLTCRPGLRDRVSIRAAGILAAELPERFGGVTAFGMLGHLNQQERATDPETLHWTMTYRVLQNDAVQREAVAEFDWHPLLPVTVAEEAAAAGLSCATAADDVLVLTAGRSTTS